MKKHKRLYILIAVMTLLAVLAGCMPEYGGGQTTAPGTASGTTKTTSGFDVNKEITVVSREDGSGTRGAFIELTGVESKDADGKKVDNTTQEASITNSTNVMMTTVSSNPYAVGYISLGALNGTVKALDVDGVQAAVENIRDGSYQLARPFLLAVKDDLNDLAKDFIAFILSAEGQAVAEASGYIPMDPQSYESTLPKGKIVVAGSSSVTPVMEKLREAYLKFNTGAEIEIQMSDSSTGIRAAIDGIADIGMASRELKDSEKEAGITEIQMAIDGIVVIVNNANTLDGLELAQIRDIFTGNALRWTEVG